MQQTDFPFVAIVVDDASTDKTPEILWNFINNQLISNNIKKEETEDYVKIVAPHKTSQNCIFVIILLKYNHHSTNKSKLPYFIKWQDIAKYQAICEGDDYWTDPLKLQKQVDYLDAHPDYTMACHRIKCFSESKQKFVREDYCYKRSRDIRVKDIIYRSGIFIPTCSIIFRKVVTKDYPKYCLKCLVGDYPLQIMCAMKGKTYYFNDLMGVYRINIPNSWTGKQTWGRYSEQRVKVIHSQINMFKGFANDYPQWKRVFHVKEIDQILRFMPKKWNAPKEDLQKYQDAFAEELGNLTFWERQDMKTRMCKNRVVRALYHKLYLKRFYAKSKSYE
jgi:glycosyltransferase involved in cell wall biosynthesis